MGGGVKIYIVAYLSKDDITGKVLLNVHAENGYIVTCTKLKGHTGYGLDMKNANYKDWITSAEEDLIELIKKTNNLIVMIKYISKE